MTSRSRRSRNPVDNWERLPHTFPVTLSCGHEHRYTGDELPTLGSTVQCWHDEATVIAIDSSELKLWCPECNKVLDTFGLRATITARIAMSEHNINQARGHHATIVTGPYGTNDANAGLW